MAAITRLSDSLCKCRSDWTDRSDRRHRPHWSHRPLRSVPVLSLVTYVRLSCKLAVCAVVHAERSRLCRRLDSYHNMFQRSLWMQV